MHRRHAADEFQKNVLSSSFEIRPLLFTLYLKVSLMRTRNSRARRQIQKAKGDLLAQKWMTNLLALILIVLIIAFVILSIPAVKKQIVDFVRVLRYGKEQKQKPKRPEIRLENPFHIFKFLLRGNSHAYQLDTL